MNAAPPRAAKATRGCAALPETTKAFAISGVDAGTRRMQPENTSEHNNGSGTKVKLQIIRHGYQPEAFWPWMVPTDTHGRGGSSAAGT